MITHATPSVDGFNLFQERLVEFAEFIVTDLQPAAIRHRWVGLPETVRQKYAAEELQLLYEKQQQQQQFPIQNVPTPSPAHQMYPSTRTMMRYPRTVAPTMVAPVRAAIPHQQRNVRVTYVYKDESSQLPPRRGNGGGHQQFQHHLQQEIYYGQPQLQNEDELVQMIARQNQLHQQRSAQMTVPRQMIRQHPNFHFTNHK